MASGVGVQNPLYMPDIVGRIFANLRFSELDRPYLVCKIWERVIENHWESFLAHKSIKHRLVESFSPYVADRSMSWKEAYRFSELAVFLTKVLDKELCAKSYAPSENPALQNLYGCFHFYMPQPRVSYGNSVFTIYHSDDVKIQKNDKSAFEVLKGEPGKMLTHLAVENDFLFALRNDGYIVQHNLITGEEKLIPTSWALGQIKTQDLRFELSGPFHVEEGYIILKYGDLGGHIFEAIPYFKPDQRKVFIDDDISAASHILVKLGKLYIFGVGHLSIWNLSTNKPIMKLRLQVSPQFHANDIAIHGFRLDAAKPSQLEASKNLSPLTSLTLFEKNADLLKRLGQILKALYADIANRLGLKSLKKKPIIFVAENRCLRAIDLETGKALKVYSVNFHEIAIIENLIFGTTTENKLGKRSWASGFVDITVMDLNTGRTISCIEDILNFETSEINPNVLKQLVEICRIHCEKFVLPPTTP